MPFQLKTQEINPSKVEIYEKHFLYGVKNINFNKSYINGDLSSLDKKYKEKYRNLNNKKIKIITDNLGFRNKIKPNDADYILVGDSFLHQLNISQKNILNNILNKNPNLKTYNAGLASTDISHYFETIKFFKDKMKLKNKKYIMFVFQGNDFLKYKLNDNNQYHKYINNDFLHNYFKFKVFFNFYNTFKYFSYSLKKNNNDNFKKVYEHKIANNNILFKFDYIYKKNTKVHSLNNILNKYENYLPDLIIFLPTKHEVYCDLIKNNKCKAANHFSVLKNDLVSTNVKVLDVTNIFKKNIKYFLETQNELLYEIDETIIIRP